MLSDRSSRRPLFAVWQWPRWTWAVAATLMLVSYFLSPPVLVQASVRLNFSPFFDSCVWRYQLPIRLLLGSSATMTAIYQWESDTINLVVGPPPFKIDWRDGQSVISLYDHQLRQRSMAAEGGWSP